MKFVETGQLCHQIKSTNTCKSVHSQVHPFVRWSQTAQMQNLHQPLCNIPIRLIVQWIMQPILWWAHMLTNWVLLKWCNNVRQCERFVEKTSSSVGHDLTGMTKATNVWFRFACCPPWASLHVFVNEKNGQTTMHCILRRWSIHIVVQHTSDFETDGRCQVHLGCCHTKMKVDSSCIDVKLMLKVCIEGNQKNKKCKEISCNLLEKDLFEDQVRDPWSAEILEKTELKSLSPCFLSAEIS